MSTTIEASNGNIFDDIFGSPEKPNAGTDITIA
jgi:hypothetical protein